MAQLRWGIMGTGGIAATMAATLAAVGSPVIAVGSGRPGAAARFAEEQGIRHALDSHHAVALHPDVDMIYVATTNDRHRQNVLDAVAAGTPVLCEKPLALNAAQAREMLGAAQAAGVLVMEAMWMRFQPFLATVDALLATGTIGPVRHVQVSFGFPAELDPTRRWLNRDLGGGALLDLGIYPLTLVYHLLGPPRRFEATAQLGSTGVDVAAQVISDHGDGRFGSIACSFMSDMANEATISGRDGRLRIHAPFHHSPQVTVERRNEVVTSQDTTHEGHGFQFEVAEVERCVAEGRVESAVHPHADTIAVLGWMDAIRARCGIEYEADRS